MLCIDTGPGAVSRSVESQATCDTARPTDTPPARRCPAPEFLPAMTREIGRQTTRSNLRRAVWEVPLPPKFGLASGTETALGI